MAERIMSFSRSCIDLDVKIGLVYSAMERAGIESIYRKVAAVVQVHRNLLIFLAIVNVVFFFFGRWMVSEQLAGVMAFREEALKSLPDLIYIKPLTGVLSPYIIPKIIYTFIFNLLVGAFLTTTAPGLVFFFPYIITVMRALTMGIIFYGLLSGPAITFAFYGTFLLEFGAYVFAAAAGINIGLSIIFPSRKGVTTRKESFRISVEEALWLYFVVVILLFLGAIWEIGWLHYIGAVTEKLTLPGNVDML